MVSWPAIRNVWHWATMLSSSQLLAGLFVDPGEHGAEQVFVLVDVSGAAPFVDDLLDFVFHVAVVLGQFLRGAAPELGLDGQGPGASLAFSQHAVHGVDEGMHGVAVEGVEAVAEAAQRDGVEGEPGHVGGDVDRLARVQPLPLVHQLGGDVVHHRYVVPHRLLAEVRQQDVVGFRPVRIIGVGGEQSRAAAEASDRFLAVPDELVEPLVITQIIDHRQPRGDIPITRRGAQSDHRTVLAGHLHHRLNRPVGRYVEHVADHG